MQGVVAGGLLRGFSYFCTTPLTILLEGGPDDGSLSASSLILRLFAGIGRPQSGQVFTFGADPAADAALRRRVALLGDPVLLDDEPLETARAIARLRGVSEDEVSPLLGADDPAGRRALCDALANVAEARLVLLAFPERYGPARDAVLATVRAALERGAQVIVATRSLDEVLAFAPDDRALAVIVAGGVAAAAAPAHGLPWAAPTDGLRTRLVRVLLGGPAHGAHGSEGAAGAAGRTAAARLASELLSDEHVASSIASIEPVSPEELRVHTRDPRAVSRAVAARAKEGLEVRAMTVYGATTAELLGGQR